MANKSNYYYLKIKEDFFDTEDMKLLESMENGYLYSNILMKMYLLSLKKGGKLMYKDKIPYSPKMLSTIIGHNTDIIEKAIDIFRNLNLIEILDSGAIFMLDIQNFIGKSSDEADRIRAYRNKIENEKNNLLQMYNTCSTNIDNIKDINRDKDIDIDITTTTNNNINNNSNSSNNLFDYIESNYGRTLSPIEYEKIAEWDDNELTRYAIKQSVLNGVRKINYVESILQSYKSLGIKTVVEAQEQEEKFKNKNQTKTLDKQKTSTEKMEDVFARFLAKED